MNPLKNEKGIALVTSLMLTVLSLVMVIVLLYIVSTGTQLSAGHKRYKTALEASYGGVELFTKDIMPKVFQGYSSSLVSDFSIVGLSIPNTSCLNQKMNTATAGWSAACSKTLDAKASPDLQFYLKSELAGFQAQPKFMVYSKIVDTVIGNTDNSNVQLEGAGVTETSGSISPVTIPYVFRIEVQGERENTTFEKGKLSVLYAF